MRLLPRGMPDLQRQKLPGDLGAPQGVKLEILLLGRPFCALLFLKQPPAGAGFVASGLIGGACGLTWKHGLSLLFQQICAQGAGKSRAGFQARGGAEAGF